MRISDWSSDVCSSDLMFFITDTGSGGFIATMSIGMAISYTLPAIFLAAVVALQYIDIRIRREGLDVQLMHAAETAAREDRKGVVSGQSVAVRVDPGGRRRLQNKQQKKKN